MIGIMLDIQSNQCLGDSECNGEFEGGGLGSPEVVEYDVEANVEEGAEEVSVGSEFLSSAYDFEYFSLDLAFEFRVEDVAGKRL